MVAAQQQKPKQTQMPTPSRMTLAAVSKGKQVEPERIVLYGPEGVGKSTFGADMPEPIILPVESGTKHLDVSRLPQPETWREVFEAIHMLTVEEHPYKTLVVDTLDAAQTLLFAHMCRRDSKANIEEYGYAKGYEIALDEWRLFVSYLEKLRQRRGMNILLLAHSWVKTFKNPEGDDYDRYEMKLHPKAAGFIKEQVDHVLFANFEVVAKKDKQTKRVKGVSTGSRWLYTTRTAAFDAKHRGVLPEQLPLSWADFSDALKAQAEADPATLVAEIQRKAGELGGDLEKKALGGIEKAAGDTAKLAQLNNWCNAHLAAREQEQTTAKPGAEQQPSAQ